MKVYKSYGAAERFAIRTMGEEWNKELLIYESRLPNKKALFTVHSRKGFALDAKKRSTVKNASKLVWEIADSMPDADRKAIISACVESGIGSGTASTQYQKWKRETNHAQ